MSYQGVANYTGNVPARPAKDDFTAFVNGSLNERDRKELIFLVRESRGLPEPPPGADPTAWVAEQIDPNTLMKWTAELRRRLHSKQPMVRRVYRYRGHRI